MWPPRIVIVVLILDLRVIVCTQGGIAFLGVKGLCRLYYKQQQFVRQAQRRVLDFEEPTVTLAASSTHTPRSSTGRGSDGSAGAGSNSPDRSNIIISQASD
jgi:hypothetical protein